MTRQTIVALNVALAAVAVYLICGLATYSTTADRLATACHPGVGRLAHVALWPISYGFTASLRSAC